MKDFAEPAHAEDGESDEEAQTKKVATADSARLSVNQAAAPKRRSSGKKKPKDEVSEEDDALDCELPPQLRAVAQEMKTVPKCFHNLQVQRIISGARLMRSVESAASSGLDVAGTRC